MSAEAAEALVRDLAALLTVGDAATTRAPSPASVGDAGKDAATGIATTASVIATASAAASTAVGSLVLTTLGVSAAVVSTVPVVGWIAGAALAIAAACVAIGNWLSHNWTPAEAAAGLKLMRQNPAFFGMIAPPAAWTSTARRAEVWASLINSWQEISGHQIPPIFRDVAWIRHAIQQGELMAALPGPIGARFLLATLPHSTAPSVTGFDAWLAHIKLVAQMTDAEYAASDHVQAQRALENALTMAIARERGFTPFVDVYESSMIADQRGALWALAHPTDGRAVPPAIKAAEAFRAYVSSWHAPYEGRDTPDAPLGGGCKDRSKSYPAKAKKALDMLRAQPEAFGWLDLAWVNSLGYSRVDNFMSTNNAGRCVQADQLKDLVDGFAKCIGDDPMNDGDTIRGYLARAQALGAPPALCTPSGTPYLAALLPQVPIKQLVSTSGASGLADLVLNGLRNLLEVGS